MKHIKIGIPEVKDWIRWFRILRFKLTGGFSCIHCNEKNKFDHVHFDSEVNGTRLMFENHTAGICAKCTQDEINEYAHIVFNNDTCKCQWCNTVKPTATFIHHKEFESFVTFGSQWWNGHNICQQCLNKGIDSRGPTYSSITKHENGKIYYQNELGLWIKIKED